MARYTYTGSEQQVYPQYLDAEKGTTLVADPGGTYDVAQVEGLTAPGEPDEDGGSQPVELKLAMPPDDRWKPARAKQKETD